MLCSGRLKVAITTGVRFHENGLVSLNYCEHVIHKPLDNKQQDHVLLTQLQLQQQVQPQLQLQGVQPLLPLQQAQQQ